ncbi:MAG: 30S ribosomal protein S21 [Candidatus Shikimatogenerans bostrichidophilus]|nr:MAG: 30S ribosomal protein S21 [Candidatus Shikimatogenerans bostrichidophilus]
MKLITRIKEGQSIEKALKIYKKKITKLNLIKSLKNKLYYLKPSIKKRLIKNKKKYLIKNIINIKKLNIN